MSKYKADLHEFFVKLHDIKEIFSGSRLDARIFDKTNQEVGVIHPYNRSFQLKVGKYEYEAARNDVKEVFDSQYQPESPILILFGDSFHKIDGPGSADYQREHSILDQDLDSDTKYSQVHSRQYVLHCLKNGGLTWQNTDLKDSYFNQALTPGEDFGGDAAEPGVSYMPAIERYNGDFYVGLGEEGKQRLLSSGYHILILSGLYGLVCPLEPVQMYDCILDEHNPNFDTWKLDSCLTRVLANYIRKYNIRRIFEFTSIHDYRNVIDWGSLKHTTNSVEVFHCFYKHADGPKGLRTLGQFVKNVFLNLSEEQLLQIEPGSECEHVIFSDQSIRTNKAEKLPLPDDWGTLNFDAIPDEDVRRQLADTEEQLVTLYRSPKTYSDAGSSIWLGYTKGLEKMLHNEVARRLRAYVFSKYANDAWRLDGCSFGDLPKQLKDILSTKEDEVKHINLGGWAYLRENLQDRACNPLVSDILTDLLAFIDQEFGVDFDRIQVACKYFSDHRGRATHTGMYTLKDIIEERRTILAHLNVVIDILYKAYWKDRDRLLSDAQSDDRYERLDAILALGNVCDSEAVDQLIYALSDPDFLVRGFAAVSLGRLRDKRACMPLMERHFTEHNWGVKIRIVCAYNQLGCE
jgi:hypothetical protein